MLLPLENEQKKSKTSLKQNESVFFGGWWMMCDLFMYNILCMPAFFLVLL